MPLDSSYAKGLARKSGPPDPMEALSVDVEDETEPEDEDADEAAAMSAYEDFARAAGFKASPKTFAALKELIRLIK